MSILISFLSFYFALSNLVEFLNVEMLLRMPEVIHKVDFEILKRILNFRSAVKKVRSCISFHHNWLSSIKQLLEV